MSICNNIDSVLKRKHELLGAFSQAKTGLAAVAVEPNKTKSLVTLQGHAPMLGDHHCAWGHCTHARGAAFAAFAPAAATRKRGLRPSVALGGSGRLTARGGNAPMLGAAHCAWGASHYAFMSP